MYSVVSWFKAAKKWLSLLILVAPVDKSGIGITASCQNDLYLARLCICLEGNVFQKDKVIFDPILILFWLNSCLQVSWRWVMYLFLAM